MGDAGPEGQHRPPATARTVLRPATPATLRPAVPAPPPPAGPPAPRPRRGPRPPGKLRELLLRAEPVTLRLAPGPPRRKTPRPAWRARGRKESGLRPAPRTALEGEAAGSAARPPPRRPVSAWGAPRPDSPHGFRTHARSSLAGRSTLLSRPRPTPGQHFPSPGNPLPPALHFPAARSLSAWGTPELPSLPPPSVARSWVGCIPPSVLNLLETG